MSVAPIGSFHCKYFECSPNPQMDRDRSLRTRVHTGTLIKYCKYNFAFSEEERQKPRLKMLEMIANLKYDDHEIIFYL